MYFNQERARDYMRQCDLDVLIATSPVNITYFSGYFCWLDPTIKGYMVSPGAPSRLALPAYAVFPLEGEPALILNPLFAINGADLWVRDIRIFGDYRVDDTLAPEELPEQYRHFHDLLSSPPESKTGLDALTSVLKDRGLLRARIGVEMEGLSAQRHDEIRQELADATVKDCSNLILLVRMVKNDYELELLTRSAEINERAGMEALSHLRPGISLPDLTLIYRTRAGECGANFDHFCIGLGGLGMATEPDYKFTGKEVFMVDFGCIYQYCFSDTGTTLAMNNLPEQFSTRFEALRDCVSEGMEAVCPGVKSSTVQGIMKKKLSERGFEASSPHGHGLGLEVRDYPTIEADNGLRIRDDCVDLPSDLPLEKNMVINLEASMFLPGVASFQMERSLVVTEKGVRSLVPQDRERPYIAASP